MFCDAAVGSIQQITSTRALVPVGGGGTDMREGFERANHLRPKPDLVICITDGETPWPSKPYRFRTIICLVDKDTKEGCPEWATVVMIKSRKEKE
jgi:predicted metal-dependent peptidase